MELFEYDALFELNQPTRIRLDLPDAEVIHFQIFFSPKESKRLYNNLYDTIAWQQDQIKIFGKLIDLPRLTAWVGEEGALYTYSGIAMQPQPWSKALLFIKKRIEKEAGVVFTNCLLNLYRTGKDSVGWHQDNEPELGKNPTIGSVSFGATRAFQLKHRYRKDLKKITIPLTDGSFLLMQETTQHFWKHQIPKTTKIVKPRINLTFRIIK